jgi:hypothetical protein
MIPLCRHLKTNGVRCRAIALREKPYCYYHDRLHRVIHKQKAAQKKSLPSMASCTNPTSRKVPKA